MKTPLTASSATDCNQQPLLFQDLGGRKVVADFSGGTLSSDGGVLLLRQVDANLGVTQTLAQCFCDLREPVFVDHSVQQLLAQRIYGLALGYEDINDHERLRLDPLLATACNKVDPLGVWPWPGLARAIGWSCPITRARVATRCRTIPPRLKLACCKWECVVCPNIPGRRWSIWMRWAIGCTACKRGGTLTPIMMIIVICRSTLSWVTFRCGHNCGPPITTSLVAWFQRWSRSWRPFGNAAARHGLSYGGTVASVGRRSWPGARGSRRSITAWDWAKTPC